MGLRGTFDTSSAGLPLMTPLRGIPIDYSDGFFTFGETFIAEAQNAVPVDTGYLQSTITADSYSMGSTFYTDCDYAQYVEYGTYKMAAQPYFEPAVDAAAEASAPYFQQAIAAALIQETIILTEEMDAQVEEATDTYEKESNEAGRTIEEGTTIYIEGVDTYNEGVELWENAMNRFDLELAWQLMEKGAQLMNQGAAIIMEGEMALAIACAIFVLAIFAAVMWLVEMIMQENDLIDLEENITSIFTWIDIEIT